MKNVKKLKYSINSSIIVIGAIIAVILLNSILVAFDDKMSLEIDLTQNEIYKLSDATKQVVKNIDKETKIGILYDGRQVDETDDFLTVMKTIVDKYTEENEKIKPELIDYYNDPTPLLKEYPEAVTQEMYVKNINLMYAMIIVQGDKYEIADADSYFVQSYQKETGTIENKSAIEKVLTNKLAEFTGDRESFSAILYTKGHGEKVNSTIGSLLVKNGHTPARVELANFNTNEGENPLIIINSPSTDFTEEEIEKLDAFLKSGKNAQIYFNPLLSNEELPRLESYLADTWGIVRNHGVIYDNQKTLSLPEDDKSVYGSIAVGEYTEHEIISDIKASGMRIMYSAANALDIAADKESKIKVSSVLETSDEAILKPLDVALDAENSDGVKGKYNVILSSVRESYTEAGEKITGKVLVCGSSYTMDTLPLQTDCANEELLINSFNWMCGNDSSISVDVKAFPEGGLIVENTPKWIWFSVLVVIVPILILGAGIFVFIKRRYK